MAKEAAAQRDLQIQKRSPKVNQFQVKEEAGKLTCGKVSSTSQNLTSSVKQLHKEIQERKSDLS
jgi:hypothetical protein